LDDNPEENPAPSGNAHVSNRPRQDGTSLACHAQPGEWKLPLRVGIGIGTDRVLDSILRDVD